MNPEFEGKNIVGIRLTLELLSQMFREGYGYRIIENGISDRFKFAHSHYDSQTHAMVFVYKTDDCPEGVGVAEDGWIVPVALILPDMHDIKRAEIVVSEDKTKVWINSEEKCILRLSNLEHLGFDVLGLKMEEDSDVSETQNLVENEKTG